MHSTFTDLNEDFPEEEVNTLIPSLSFSSFQEYWEWRDERQKIKEMRVRDICFIVYASAAVNTNIKTIFSGIYLRYKVKIII